MNTYTIHTEDQGVHGWIAFLDGYDGAPDATGPYSVVGHADTEADAIADLITERDILRSDV